MEDRYCEFDHTHDLQGLSPRTHRCPVCSAPLAAGRVGLDDDNPEHLTHSAGQATLIVPQPTKKAAAAKKAATPKKATAARKAAATPTHPTRAPELLPGRSDGDAKPADDSSSKPPATEPTTTEGDKP